MTTTTTGSTTAVTRPEVEVVGEDADVDPRIAARREQVAGERRRGWRRRWVRALLAIIVVVALVGVGEAMLRSPLLDVDLIDVIGNTRLDQRTIVQSAGIREHEAMISVDPGAAARRLRGNPWIQRATVIRRWPGVVEIRVDERRPTALLVATGGRSMAIGSGGIVLGDRYELGDTRADGAVRTVMVNALPRTCAGATLPEPLRSTVEVAGAVPASVVPIAVPAQLGTDGQLSFATGKGQLVRFGDASEAQQKFVAIATMLGGSVDMTHFCVLDVRIPASPKVVRPPYCG